MSRELKGHEINLKEYKTGTGFWDIKPKDQAERNNLAHLRASMMD